MYRSFLTENDILLLEAMERRREAFINGGWLYRAATIMAVLILLTAAMWWCEREARHAATPGVSAEQILYHVSSAPSLTAGQASVHYWMRLARTLRFLAGGLGIFWMLLGLRHSGLWPTVRYLHSALYEKPVSPADRLMPCVRPARLSASQFDSRPRPRFFGARLLDSEERLHWYKRPRRKGFLVRQANYWSFAALAAILLLNEFTVLRVPAHNAMAIGLPWYSPYLALVEGIRPGQTCSPIRLMHIDAAMNSLLHSGYHLLVLLWYLYVLMLPAIYQTRLAAEMRRLDILLWRRVRGRGNAIQPADA